MKTYYPNEYEKMKRPTKDNNDDDDVCDPLSLVSEQESLPV